MANGAGTPKLRGATPVFLVADIASTMQWYRANLGFTGRAVPELPPHNFAIIGRDGVEIMLQRLDGYRKPDLYDEREAASGASTCRSTVSGNCLLSSRRRLERTSSSRFALSRTVKLSSSSRIRTVTFSSSPNRCRSRDPKERMNIIPALE
jgi:hypothetical protein